MSARFVLALIAGIVSLGYLLFPIGLSHDHADGSRHRWIYDPDYDHSTCGCGARKIHYSTLSPSHARANAISHGVLLFGIALILLLAGRLGYLLASCE